MGWTETGGKSESELMNSGKQPGSHRGTETRRKSSSTTNDTNNSNEGKSDQSEKSNYEIR